MKIRTFVLLLFPVFLSTITIFNSVVLAVEVRKVLSRNYVGLGVEVYAPYQCYPGEAINIRTKFEALEDVKNASVTVFILGSKSEGQSPWGTSFIVLDIIDFPSGTIEEESYNITVPSDVDPGLTYGILSIQWSIYRSPSWDAQWDKASFTVTFVKNKNYEDLETAYDELQSKYNSIWNDLQNTRTLMYVFLATTILLAVSTAYFVKRKPKLKRAMRARRMAAFYSDFADSGRDIKSVPPVDTKLLKKAIDTLRTIALGTDLNNV